MFQQGKVFKLKAKRIDGQPMWAYRYRLGGRSSARPQVGKAVGRYAPATSRRAKIAQPAASGMML